VVRVVEEEAAALDEILGPHGGAAHQILARIGEAAIGE
jgi:hypothetical protein